jgi:hypothetical protein
LLIIIAVPSQDGRAAPVSALTLGNAAVFVPGPLGVSLLTGIRRA